MEVKFDMNIRHKSVFGFLKVAHPQDFLLVILIDGLSQHMSPVGCCTILRYPLMIPLFLIDEVCPFYRKVCLGTHNSL